MNYLAIDTTNKLASAALLKKDSSVCKCTDNCLCRINDNCGCISIIQKDDSNEITHSEKLMPLIDSILEEANLNINNIDLFLTTKGPGSFTGCRIGVTTIKGLSIVKSAPIFAIPSLELLAYECFSIHKNTDLLYCSILNARNNRVYYALYKFKNCDDVLNTEYIIPSSSDDIEICLENVYDFSNGNKVIFCGDSISIYGETIEGYNINFETDYEDATLNAESLIEYYESLNNTSKESKMFNTFSLDVEYVRPSQAERMKNGEK